MRVSFQNNAPGAIEFGILYGSFIIAALAVAYFFPILDLAPPCLFRESTGIPCPTCGTSRSLVEFSRGHLAGSFVMNPLAALVILFGVLAFLANTVMLFGGLPRPKFMLNDHEGTVLRYCVIALVLFNWVYLALSCR